MTALRAALIWSMLASTAAAQGVALGGVRNSDPDAPVEVTADRLEMDQTAGTALFTGDVLVVQGDLRLSAPRILVEYVRLEDGSPGQDVDRITASGGVVMVTPEEAAESREAVYHPLRDEVVMTGDVLLTQGPNTLNGARLVIDLATGTGRMDGRVRTILNPAQPPEDAE